jgi:hypothetical protein
MSNAVAPKLPPRDEQKCEKEKRQKFSSGEDKTPRPLEQLEVTQSSTTPQNTYSRI